MTLPLMLTVRVSCFLPVTCTLLLSEPVRTDYNARVHTLVLWNSSLRVLDFVNLCLAFTSCPICKMHIRKLLIHKMIHLITCESACSLVTARVVGRALYWFDTHSTLYVRMRILPT
ncbi:hypothetical protein TNIN_262471 [Trichonephila inaurata madagascariensis]|uniref:Uncharacterized protein n=1 Tax=Trichonephila inaurata madagascariensis TaxID=2747483 RepID=A0A8X6JU47_9ARAC|nr:hypothetical protein TNIN_262471 [Trichonephila inaurata madagascariensis]